MKELENLKKKILYRSSYRGTKEMDLLLSKFVIKYIDNLQINDLKDLEIFLDVEDEIILNFYHNNHSDKLIKNNKITNLFKNFKI